MTAGKNIAGQENGKGNLLAPKSSCPAPASDLELADSPEDRDLDRRLKAAKLRLAKLRLLAATEAEIARLESGLLVDQVGYKWEAVARIVTAVAEHYRLTISDMRGKRGVEQISRPRQVACWLARRLTDASLSKIGEAVNRDHGTVIHAVSAIDDLMLVTPAFRAEVEALEAEIRSKLATAALDGEPSTLNSKPPTSQ